MVATGDEIVPPGDSLAPGQIPDSNTTLLRAMIIDAGAELVSVDRCSDEPVAFQGLVERLAAEADVIVTTGGVSAGAYDVVVASGLALESHQVAMQPGKPQAFGRVGDSLVVGLPGNPVSVFVSFRVFIVPLLARLLGSYPKVLQRGRYVGGAGFKRDGGGYTMPELKLTHLTNAGEAHMVDVSAKQPTVRTASARGYVECSAEVMAALREGTVPKGDVAAVARIAGISAAKKVPDLLPLAHTIGVHGCVVEIEFAKCGVTVSSTVTTADRTGVEMEALTAVTVACLAIVDMVKGVDRSARILECQITAKSGGRSGEWRR
ncbi:Cyclic pyranopterin monophosphate synthase [Platysternon megacephalum]|uniref:cyclic pyranopterin monophosphate synthase n=1 Tax=Platysternon megacephalum TaxID=55544 RepID=A0A4D9DB96_9SAUR|nr:Cyclic pyranopterin monophosphate synthase [Platysternon megacephalum]